MATAGQGGGDLPLHGACGIGAARIDHHHLMSEITPMAFTHSARLSSSYCTGMMTANFKSQPQPRDPSI
jgi:hypothetical protein